MSLTRHSPVAFVPTGDAAAARAFYEGTLGLRFEADDSFALVFRIGGDEHLMLRVVRVTDHRPLPFTIFGWESSALEADVDELAARGVTFERFGLPGQDERGIWAAPGGARIAWFKDPDGNVLSLSQHPA